MVVTGIVELDKKRSKVYIDGEFAFVLYKGELRDYKIKQGCDITELDYHEITRVLLPKRCKLRAMNLLQKKDYTERQLRDKLSEGLYPSEVINDAINYVKSYHYLNDERYARDYVAYHMENRSRNRIAQDLSGKGIDKGIYMPIIEELYAEQGEDPELEQIRSLLVKKHYDPGNADYKEKQKVMGFLVRKGFPMSLINRAMKVSEFD